MIRIALVWLVLAVGAGISASANAGVICSFGGSGISGTDCLGQAWSVGNGGWGIPGIVQGNLPFPGPDTATDFHFHCIAGCGPIDNRPGQDTQFSVAPFGLNFWSEALNGTADTIDFVSGSLTTDLTPGRSFFVNITVPINVDTFQFEASWTNDSIGVPEPASLALLCIGLAGLGFSRRKR